MTKKSGELKWEEEEEGEGEEGEEGEGERILDEFDQISKFCKWAKNGNFETKLCTHIH